MQNAKKEAIDTIQRLSDLTDTEEMMYRLYALENVRRGQLDADNGNTETIEELRKEIKGYIQISQTSYEGSSGDG